MLKVFALILILSAPVLCQRKWTLTAGINRTARFEKRFEAKQWAINLTANYKLTKRLSLTLGLVQPIDTRLFSYRTGISYRIY